MTRRDAPAVDRDQAVRWISRWDAHQEWFMPDREERFAVFIDAVEAGAGRDDPLVLDLGCGPGSLAVRLLDRMPAAGERRRLSEDHHGSESVLLSQHVAALRAAGFAEIGTLWQHGDNRILCAVLGEAAMKS